MSSSFYKQFRWLEKELKNTADELVSNISDSAEKDLIEAHDQIITNYYKKYPNPRYYHRKGLNGLYATIIKHTSKKGIARVLISSDEMSHHNDYKGIDRSDLIFDLMWERGIRGLPKKGSTPLTHSFDWRGFDGKAKFPVNYGTEGQVWKNPYWNQQKYKNEFRTKIRIGSFTSTKEGTPNLVMLDFVNTWGDKRGVEVCDDVANKMSKKYEGHISYAPF